MTIHYPDISAYQAGISLSGAPAVCIKATEGTGWASRDYGPAMDRARTAGAFAFAYHFLHADDPGRQAAWCFQHVGGHTGLMLDLEPAGSSRPAVGDAVAFLDAYKAQGGICNLTYLPRWYWTQLGHPPLTQLADRGHTLVSSNYTAYTDVGDGPGWLPYGGMQPQIWQYTDRRPFNGQAVDFNAYRGTVDQLKVLVHGGSPPKPPPAPAFPYPAGHYLGQPSPSPYCHSGYYGGPDHLHVHTWQAQMAARGWTITMDGMFGADSEQVARAFQAEKGLYVDGKVGADTWRASWSAPVT